MKKYPNDSTLFVALALVLSAAPPVAFAQFVTRPVVAPIAGAFGGAAVINGVSSLPTLAPFSALMPASLTGVSAFGTMHDAPSVVVEVMPLAASAISVQKPTAFAAKAAFNGDQQGPAAYAHPIVAAFAAAGQDANPSQDGTNNRNENFSDGRIKFDGADLKMQSASNVAPVTAAKSENNPVDGQKPAQAKTIRALLQNTKSRDARQTNGKTAGSKILDAIRPLTAGLLWLTLSSFMPAQEAAWTTGGQIVGLLGGGAFFYWLCRKVSGRSSRDGGIGVGAGTMDAVLTLIGAKIGFSLGDALAPEIGRWFAMLGVSGGLAAAFIAAVIGGMVLWAAKRGRRS